MIRSNLPLLACLALSVACAKTNESTENPDETTQTTVSDGTLDSDQGDAGTDTATPTGERPKVRASTATRSGTRKTGKKLSLVAKKPPVSGGEKPHVAPKNLKAEFDVQGVFPTSAAVGSLIEVFGSGFPEDPAEAKVFIGGKPLEVVEITPDRIVAKVGAPATGVVEVGKGTGRLNRKGRAKTNGKFVATKADGAFNQPHEQVGHGLLGMVYEVDAGATEVPNFNELGAPVALVTVDDLDIAAGDAPAGIAGRTQSFGIHFQGSLNVVEAGEYEFCLEAADGALFFLDQTPVIDNDGTGSAREACETFYVEPGEYGIDLLYYQGADTEAALSLTWSRDGGDKTPVPAEAFFPPESLYDIAVAFDQG